MFLKKKSAMPVFLMAAIAATALSLGRAELVLDDEESAPAEKQVQARDEMRKAYGATQQVETSNEITTTTTVSAAPVIAEAEAPVMSRSELLRRKRIREEMKNEDLLSQRLEELRLREEEKRTKKILKSSGLADDEEETAVSRAREMSPAPVIVETNVQAPITEKSSQPNAMQMTPAPAMGMSDQLAYNQSAPMSGGSMATSTGNSNDSSTAGQISVSPRFGFASISNDFYRFNSRFAAGVAMAFSVSDHVALELGYLYSRNSINMPDFWNPYREMNYNQNLFDLSMKLFLTDSSSKVRPYVLAGAGYSMGYINYDQRTQNMIRQYSYGYSPYGTNNGVEDYELNQIIGTLGAGMDFKVAKNVAIGIGYRYVLPVSTNEPNQLYNYGFFQSPEMMQKEAVRGSLRDSTTQMFLVNGTFSF